MSARVTLNFLGARNVAFCEKVLEDGKSTVLPNSGLDPSSHPTKYLQGVIEGIPARVYEPLTLPAFYCFIFRESKDRYTGPSAHIKRPVTFACCCFLFSQSGEGL